MTPFSEDIYEEEQYTAPLGIIALAGAQELAKGIDRYLVDWYNKKVKDDAQKRTTFIVGSKYPRFTSGDGKAVVSESVRGRDLFIICDVGNHGITYNLYGQEHPMTPDEHYADLKRVICACNGKPASITVLMPMLYGGRQHKRNGRESLDCAMMLQELESMGVRDIITFDAHDPRVQNSVPLMGFDNFFPTYQILKALHRRFPAMKIDKENLMIVSPDEGAMGRNIYYASVLGLDLGMFFKRRDYSQVVNGRNPIVAHEYVGADVAGKNVFVADDIIATGDSVLKLCKDLKEKGAKDIFLTATFSLFTEGVEKFNVAYEEGLFTAVLSTNLTYRIPELKNCKWFVEADMSKYMAYIINNVHGNQSVSGLLEPYSKIKELLDRIEQGK